MLQGQKKKEGSILILITTALIQKFQITSVVLRDDISKVGNNLSYSSRHIKFSTEHIIDECEFQFVLDHRVGNSKQFKWHAATKDIKKSEHLTTTTQKRDSVVSI